MTKKKIVFFILVVLLFYTRLGGLKWGYPYPFHPDENNMVRAIEQLNCTNAKNCLHPHFFAYGQPPLYAAYGISNLFKNFIDARMALRVISSLSSILTAFVLIKIVNLLVKKDRTNISLFMITFAPYFIQLSHFGTTESLLMLMYSMIVYISLKIIENKELRIHYVIIVGLLAGFSIAVKVSAVLFAIAPVAGIVFRGKKKFRLTLMAVLIFALCVAGSAVIFSPYNILAFDDFYSSMQYETGVGRGLIKVFYTRSFDYSLPFVFQIFKVFPYSHGVLQFFLCLLAFSGALWKFDKKSNLVRIAIIAYLVPTAILYAKWARFMSPVFPLITIFFILAIVRLEDTVKRWVIIPILIFLAIPGIAYFSIYLKQDVRIEASKWIYENVPNNSYILSETANVVDIPLPIKISKIQEARYNVVSFDFYNVDTDEMLKRDLQNHLALSDYIFIPSRRIFMNHTCLSTGTFHFPISTSQYSYVNDRCVMLLKEYPILNSYYDELFNRNNNFKKVAEFTSYPRIELLGKKIIEFPDEDSEETWTVFDHPVIRIYKRI